MLQIFNIFAIINACLLINQITAIESQTYVDTLHNGKSVRTIQVGFGENVSLICIVKPNHHTVFWQTKNVLVELPTKTIATLNLFNVRRSETYTCESPSAELKRPVSVIARKRIRRSDYVPPLSLGDSYLDDVLRKEADMLKHVKDQLDISLHPKPERNNGVIPLNFGAKIEELLNQSKYDWKNSIFNTNSKSDSDRKYEDALKEEGLILVTSDYGWESNNKPEPETKNRWNFNTNSRDDVVNWNKPERNDWIDSSKNQEKNDWELYDAILNDENNWNQVRNENKKKWTRNIAIIVGSILVVGFSLIMLYVAVSKYRSSKTEQPTNTSPPQTTVRIPELQPLNTQNTQPGRPIETYITPYPPERSSSMMPSPSAPIDDYQFNASRTKSSEPPPPSYDEAVYNAK